MTPDKNAIHGLRGYLLLSLLLMLCYEVGWSQELKFIHIGTEQGLPSSEVYSIIQDRKGYIWGSTDAGIFRYNGEKFNVFTKNQGLPDNTIFHLTEDSKGRIWMAGMNKSVAYIQNDSIVQIAANKDIQNLLKVPTALILSIMEGDDGSIELGTTHLPITILPANNFAHAVIDSSSDKTAAFVVRGTRHGIITASVNNFDPKGLNFKIAIEKGDKLLHYNPSIVGSSNIRAIRTGSDEILIGVSNLLMYIDKNNTLLNKRLEKYITTLYSDRNNAFWTGSASNGLHYYPHGDLNEQPLQFLKGLTPTCVIEDYEGGIWVSTIERGIYYAPNKYVFNYASSSILNGHVNGMGLSPDHHLIGVTTDYQFFRMDDTQVAYSYKNTYPITFRQFFRFSTYENDLFGAGYYSGKLSPEFRFTSFYKSEQGVPCGGSDILPVSADSQWLVVDGWLLLMYQNKIKKNYEIPAKSVQIRKDRQGQIWIATFDGAYTLRNEHIVRIPIHPAADHDRITAMLSMDDGTMVLATRNNGVFLYKDGKCERLTVRDGLGSNKCTALTRENSSKIWVATSNGVSCIALMNGERAHITNFDLSNGLISNEINDIIFLQNRLWLASKKGLMFMATDQAIFNTTPPLVSVSGFQVNGLSIPSLNNRDLPYNENTIRMDIDVLTFKKQGATTFYYRLKGSSNESMKLGSGRTLELQNLLPGTYQLEIYGMNNNGILSDFPLVYSFTILPAFWTTWWFISICLLSALIITWLVFRWQLRVSNRKQEEKAAYQQQLSQYQLTALRSQMNPHFIFNAFNGIQRYVLQKDKFETYEYITKFSQLIRDVLEESSKDSISLEKEIEMIRTYVEIEQLRFDNGFDFDLHVEVVENDLNIELPGMLLQPLIENAIWHGLMPLKDRIGRLEVSIAGNEDVLKICIRDNGIGRSASDRIRKNVKHTSYGMKLIQDRIRLINENGIHHRIDLQYTDLSNEHNESVGTEVCIQIHYINPTT